MFSRSSPQRNAKLNSKSSKFIKSKPWSPSNPWKDPMLSDEKLYALTEEQQQLKKQLICSKNNILIDAVFEKPSKRKVSIAKAKPKNEEAVSISYNAQREELLDMMDYEESIVSTEDHSMFESGAAATHLRALGVATKPTWNLKSPNKQPVKTPKKDTPAINSPVIKHTKVTVTNGLGNDEDLDDIVEQIVLLTNELKYYEELSGKRSVFDLDVRICSKWLYGYYIILCI